MGNPIRDEGASDNELAVYSKIGQEKNSADSKRGIS